MKVIASFLFMFLSSGVFAGNSDSERIDHYFELLKDLPVDYTSHGAVCEYMAKYQFRQQYSADQYDVVVGIVYKNHERIIGELDLIVFRKTDGEAIAFGEVKCRKRAQQAHSHALEQLARFRSTMDSNEAVVLYLGSDPAEQFYRDEFDEQPEQWTISHKGTQEQGFTYELELSLDDVHILHERLYACQRKGGCGQH